MQPAKHGYVVRADTEGGPSIYYHDTRDEHGWGGCSDIFSSSTDPGWATHYPSEEAARAWAEEFLDGFPYVIEHTSLEP